MNCYSVETSNVFFPRPKKNFDSTSASARLFSDVKSPAYSILDSPFKEFNSIINSILTERKFDSSSTSNEFIPSFPTETFLYNLKFFNKINFQNHRKINQFLIKHSDIIIDFLVGCQVTIETFGNEKYQLSIEEGDIKEEYLLLSVLLQNYEPNVLTNLNKIFESYSDSIKGKSAYFVVTADF